MTLSDLILEKGQILLSQTLVENMFLDNSSFLYGNVKKVSDLSEIYNIDDTVLFDAGDATKFLLDGSYYYLTKEDRIHLTFTIITP